MIWVILELGGCVDPLAGRVLDTLRGFLGRARRAHVDDHDLVDTGVAVARKIVGRDRLGVGRDREIDAGSLAAVGLEQRLDMANLVRRLTGIEIEAAPSVAILSDAAQRRAALAAEEDR